MTAKWSKTQQASWQRCFPTFFQLACWRHFRMWWKKAATFPYIDHTNAMVRCSVSLFNAMERCFYIDDIPHDCMAENKFYKNRFSFHWDRFTVLRILSHFLKFQYHSKTLPHCSTTKVGSKVASYYQKPSFWTLWNHIWTFVVLLDRVNIGKSSRGASVLTQTGGRVAADTVWAIWQFWFFVIEMRRRIRWIWILLHEKVEAKIVFWE